jgi:hypothetical protein
MWQLGYVQELSIHIDMSLSGRLVGSDVVPRGVAGVRSPRDEPDGRADGRVSRSSSVWFGKWVAS